MNTDQPTLHTHTYRYRMISMYKSKQTRMIKKLKIQGIEFNNATKSKETRNKILGRENILA